MAIVAVRQFFLQTTQPGQHDFVEIFKTGLPIPQDGDFTGAVITTMRIPRADLEEVEFTVDERAQLTTNKVAKFPLDQRVVLTESVVVDKSSVVSIAGPQWVALILAGSWVWSLQFCKLNYL